MPDRVAATDAEEVGMKCAKRVGRNAAARTSRTRLAAACTVTPLVAACEAIGDVFQAGSWFGVIIVVALIALVIWGISKMFGR
jgi:hypothetical protein